MSLMFPLISPEFASRVGVVLRVSSQRVAHIPFELCDSEPIIVLFRVDVEFAVIGKESVVRSCGNLNA